MRPSRRRTFADITLSDEAIEWVVRLHSGAACERDHAGFAAWRGQSVGHEAAAAEAEALWLGLGTAGGQVRAQGGPRRLTRRALVLGGGAVALGLAATASNPLRRRLLADHSTGVGETREIVLPDGSRAMLNSSTALALDYSAQLRQVHLLDGQALFTVTPDTDRPFRVAAGNGWSRAVGTAFDVDMRAESVAVTVVEGKVAVGLEGTVAPSVLLQADEAVRYGPGGVAVPQRVDAAMATAWRRGKLIFNRRPLEDVASELQRHTHTRILIAGSGLKALEVTGVFDLNDPVGVLETIEQTLPVRVLRLPLVNVIL